MITSSDASRVELERLRRLLPWTTLAWLLVAAANVVASLIPLRWYLLITSERAVGTVPFVRLLFPEPELRTGALDVATAARLAQEQPMRVALLLALFYLLVATPLLVAFLFRSHRALVAAQGPRPRFAAHWTITGFLLPFANLVLPLLVVRDLWRCAAARADGAPTEASGSPLPRVWWEVWILGVLLNGAWGVLIAFNPIGWAAIGIAGSLVNAVGAVLTILLARGLLALQSARVEGREPAAPLAFLPPSLGVDTAVLCLLALFVVVGQQHVGSRAAEARARILVGRPTPDARALAAVEPMPTSSVHPREIALVEPRPIGDDAERGAAGAVTGGAEGGVASGIVGGASAAPAAALPENDEPLRVGGDVTPPIKIAGDQAKYTEIARRARIQGIVVLEIVVDRAGEVTETRVLKPLPMGLDGKAIDAVRTWKFRPATFQGKPVAVYFIVTVNFRLDR